MPRETTVWVPISRIVPHPDNPNKMSKELYEKLRANIDMDQRYPPLVVRSMERTVQFPDLMEADKLQLLDGEHRLKLLTDLGHKDVEVAIWRDVSDEKAMHYLLTLNRIEGEDDPAKRRHLLRSLLDISGNAAELAAVIPENVEEIEKAMAAEVAAAMAGAGAAMAALNQSEIITVFCSPGQAETIKSAIKRWQTDNDPARQITEHREGAALADICENAYPPD